MRVMDPQAIVGSLRHPLRQEILVHCLEQGRPLSPSQLAQELGERLNTVRYHIRVLGDAGALIAVDEQWVEGSTQHRYVADATIAGMPWLREALAPRELPDVPYHRADDDPEDGPRRHRG
jgi:DNA-binding transcriptional ArsR family regulator